MAHHEISQRVDHGHRRSKVASRGASRALETKAQVAFSDVALLRVGTARGSSISAFASMCDDTRHPVSELACLEVSAATRPAGHVRASPTVTASPVTGTQYLNEVVEKRHTVQHSTPTYSMVALCVYK